MLTVKKQRCLRVNTIRASLGMTKLDILVLLNKSNNELQKIIRELINKKKKEQEIIVTEETVIC